MKLHRLTILIFGLILSHIPDRINSQSVFTGFMDLQKSHDLNTNQSGNIEVSQFEFGLEGDLTALLSGSVIAAYNPDERILEPGTALLSYTLIQTDEKSRSKQLVISAGLFDVPFGLDYRYIASPDRNMITPSALVRKTVNNINDTGLLIVHSGNLLNTNLYALSDFQNYLSWGLRICLNLAEKLEAGSSIYRKRDLQNSVSGEMYGVDFSYNTHHFELKGEYIHSNGICEGELEGIESSGYYLEFTSKLERLIDLPILGLLRYGSCRKSGIQKGFKYPEEVALGFAYCFYENLTGRVEYLNEFNNRDYSSKQVKVQVVFSI